MVTFLTPHALLQQLNWSSRLQMAFVTNKNLSINSYFYNLGLILIEELNRYTLIDNGYVQAVFQNERQFG